MSEDQRKELGAFLKARRAAIAPKTLGYDAGARRRTPGLRREEVASEAGVGITWYTWLEQGRDIRPSATTLLRICGTLRLERADQDYAFSLAGLLNPDAQAVALLTPSLAAVFQAYQGPAMYLDPMWNVLAHNGIARALYDLDQLVGPFETNQLWQAFRNPLRRRLYVNFERDVRAFVGLFRLVTASVVAEPEFQTLIERLMAESAEFAALWRQREVVSPIPLAIELNHPRFGRIAVHSLRVPVDRGGGAMMLFLAPADEATERAFRRVAEELRQEVGGG